MVAWIWATGMLGSKTITFGPNGAAVGAALAPPPPTSASSSSGRARTILDRAMEIPLLLDGAPRRRYPVRRQT